jgi:DNA-binding IclR family transcriptional regulator
MDTEISGSDPMQETDAYWKLLHLFFARPTDVFSLSDLAELLEIGKTTANRVVKSLEEEGFLHIEVLGRIWRITCD